MTISKQFSKYANQYDNNNIIQRIISKALIRELDFKPKTILELGCGNGQLYRQIDYQLDSYTAIDFSQNMCNLHPKDKNIDVQCFDFDSVEFKDFLKDKSYDIILSSSALQWSKDIAKLLQNLATVSNHIQCVLFTSNTFKTIYEITKKAPPILSKDSIIKAFRKYDMNFEVLNYILEFQTKKELFSYIKNSGVQGDVSLSYKEAKSLYKNYNIDYLEFEVIFIKAKLKSF